MNTSTRSNSMDNTQPVAVQPDMETVLAADMARAIHQLGLQSMRATVVDLTTMSLLTEWSVNESGHVVHGVTGQSPDSAYPGGSATVAQLTHAFDDDTMVLKLSPRRWSVAWRLNASRAAVAQAQFRERRDAISDGDAAFIRLLCNSGIRAGLAMPPPQAANDPNLEWPNTDRRTRRQNSSMLWTLAGLALTAALLTAWLGLFVLPSLNIPSAEQKTTAARQQALAAQTVEQRLTATLATGDYGDLQAELSLFESLGQVRDAAVVNAKGRVVALVGQVDRLRIGNPVPADVANVAPARPLSSGSLRHGELLLSATGPSVKGLGGTVLVAQMLACLASLTIVGLLMTRLRAGNRGGRP